VFGDFRWRGDKFVLCGLGWSPDLQAFTIPASAGPTVVGYWTPSLAFFRLQTSWELRTAARILEL